MKQMAYQYFHPLINAFTSIFTLKKHVVLLGSIITIFIEWLAQTHFLGVSMALILITLINIFYNTITGAIASDYEAKKCLKKGDKICYENKKFDPKKLMFVVFKLITFFSWLFIAKATNDSFTGTDIFNSSFKIIGLIPVVLFLLHEFISANKNVKRRYGEYPYLATPIMKIFDTLELKFDKMLSL